MGTDCTGVDIAVEERTVGVACTETELAMAVTAGRERLTVGTVLVAPGAVLVVGVTATVGVLDIFSSPEPSFELFPGDTTGSLASLLYLCSGPYGVNILPPTAE